MKDIELEIGAKGHQLGNDQSALEKGCAGFGDDGALQLPHRKEVTETIRHVNDLASSSERGDATIKGAGAIEGKRDDIGMFVQDISDGRPAFNIEARDVDAIDATDFADGCARTFKGDAALMIEESDPDVIDVKMPDAGDDFLQLDLFAGNGGQAGHVSMSLFDAPS
jgi:hypothetical protein